MDNLMVCVAIVHCYAESVRLASFLCSAILLNDHSFLLGIAIAIPQNLLVRNGWVQYSLAHLRCLQRKGYQYAALIAHRHCKFTMGYSPFIVPCAALLSRLLQGHTPVLYSSPGLICFSTCLAAEIIEDALIYYEYFPHAPVPNPDAYKELDKTDPQQLFTFSNSSNRLVSVQETQGFQSAWLQHRAQHVSRALRLHGVTHLQFWKHGTVLMPGTIFFLCLMQLILGSGFIFSSCSFPISVEHRIQEAVVWHRPLICQYNNASVWY